MRRYSALILAFICVLVMISCSETETEGITGTIKFYSEPAKQFTAPVSADSVKLTKEQKKEIKSILDNVEVWVDDYLVDRVVYYFDGEFKLSDSEFVYYFSYEYNLIYYDHYFAEIAKEEMQFIKDLNT